MNSITETIYFHVGTFPPLHLPNIVCEEKMMEIFKNHSHGYYYMPSPQIFKLRFSTNYLSMGWILKSLHDCSVCLSYH